MSAPPLVNGTRPSLPANGNVDVRNDWHHCRIVQAEMVHFLRQIQSFCQLEVIECSWQALMEFTAERRGDLDSLIQAHRTYLNRVVRKILLLSSKRDKEVCDASAKAPPPRESDACYRRSCSTW